MIICECFSHCGIKSNLTCFFNLNSTSPIVFSYQLPLPREGYQLDYSRWMSNLIGIINPDFTFRKYTNVKGPLNIDTVIDMKVVLAVKNIGNEEWKVYARKDNLKRYLKCLINSQNVCHFLF